MTDQDKFPGYYAAVCREAEQQFPSEAVRWCFNRGYSVTAAASICSDDGSEEMAWIQTVADRL